MTENEALLFIQDIQMGDHFVWADLGAGKGVFTRALANTMSHTGTIYAVDTDSAVLTIASPNPMVSINALQADFTSPFDCPPLDGILMANALHYVKEPILFLKQLLGRLRPGGLFLLIEYDRDIGNQWVPYPISFRRLPALLQAVGLSDPVLINERQSTYGQGQMYLTSSVKK